MAWNNLEDTCGIGRRDQHIVEYDGCANFMKGAIETADKITTVSPTYAQEYPGPLVQLWSGCAAAGEAV